MFSTPKIRLFLLFSGLFFSFLKPVFSQPFTHQDSLRGSITPERAWWDLTYYNLDISVNATDSTISGRNSVYFTALTDGKKIQIELQKPLAIESVLYDGKKLKWKLDGYSYLIEFPKTIKKGAKASVEIVYSGKPVVSNNPPWTGGFTWKKDSTGKPFIATSVQGDGASLFWPNKDHMYDEPDSMTISITPPKGLTAVANGRLRSTKMNADSTKKFVWHVSNPINNYGVNVNIGDYVHFGEVYAGEKGPLDCDYWVLSYNLEKAKEQFKDAKRTLQAFEYWFGPYPFYEDSFKLVEVPYLGMEHQSSVTYGNSYKNGYRGRDLSGTGWGMLWDFIIIHEVGHEWFANNVTYKDIADMWIHESFTNYSESLFLEFHYGKTAAYEYVRGLRAGILNDKPIISAYNVNTEGSGDMYNKGGNMLHTIRQLVPSDSLWREMLRGLNRQFYHQTVETKQIETFMGEFLSIDLAPIFNQYLRDVRIPVLQYRLINNKIVVRWNQTVKGFNLPVRVTINGIKTTINPTLEWKPLLMEFGSLNSFVIDPDYYVLTQDVTSKTSVEKAKSN